MNGILGILLISTTLTFHSVNDSASALPVWIDSNKTLAQVFLDKGEEYYPEGLKRQRAIRRKYQQWGYINVLYDVEAQDPLSCLFSFLKMYLWTTYSTPHLIYWLIPPEPTHHIPGYPYPDDASYPANPWKKLYEKKR
jgi:hypothetical protein